MIEDELVAEEGAEKIDEVEFNPVDCVVRFASGSPLKPRISITKEWEQRVN